MFEYLRNFANLDAEEQLKITTDSLNSVRQMQADRLSKGVDYIDDYIDNVDGDWLINWGDDNDLEDNDLENDILQKVRNRLSSKTIEQIIIDFERIYQNFEPWEWRNSAGNLLFEQVATASPQLRSENQDELYEECCELAEELIEHLASLWEQDNE